MKGNIILERKIAGKIKEFFESDNKRALLVTGARQVGKTFLIRELGRKAFKSFIAIDMIENRDARRIFENANDSKDILTRISALTNQRLIPGETLIFLDEVQECKESIAAIKYLVEEGSYKYILSGSLLGVELYNVKSIPVGYMDSIVMYPLDFEEFAIANGVSREVIGSIRDSFGSRTPVDGPIHEAMLRLFRLYIVVGGMPAVVTKYLETSNIADVVEVQTNIIERYREDISKYERLDRKLRIKKVFDLIPSELNDRNKRFVLSDVEKTARRDRYENTFEWLEDAGVAIAVYNAKEPILPLKLSQTATLFKLFLSDVGLLAAMYMDGIQLRILNDEKNINFGSVYENVTAQELRAHGFKDIYFFNSRKQGELDFLIPTSNEVVPIEVKSGKDYTTHAALTKVLDNKDYGIRQAYVFSNANVTVEGRIAYMPIYMLMFLKKDGIPDGLVYKPNIDALKT